MNTSEHFLKPTAFERAMNKTVGLLARYGLGPSYLHLLRVRGKKTGKIYSTPVNLFQLKGKLYLVGGRGHTTWSKNAGAAGEVTLVRGRRIRNYQAVSVPAAGKPEILKGYLEEYRGTVQKFFPVQANSPVEAFRAITERHPVFELR